MTAATPIRRRLLRLVLVCGAALYVPAVAAAQPVVNPTTAEFDPSTDHNATLPGGGAAVTRYDLGFYLVGAASPVQVNDLGKPTPQGTGKIRVPLGAVPSPGIRFRSCRS